MLASGADLAHELLVLVSMALLLRHVEQFLLLVCAYQRQLLQSAVRRGRAIFLTATAGSIRLLLLLELSGEGLQLFHEAGVGVDEPAFRTDKLRGSLKTHAVLAHEVRDDRRGRAADTGVAVNKDTTALSKRVLDETMHRREVLLEVRSRAVELADPLVGVLLGKLGVQAGAHAEDVRDPMSVQDVLVARRDMVSQKETIDDFVEWIDALILVVDHLPKLDAKTQKYLKL